MKAILIASTIPLLALAGLATAHQDAIPLDPPDSPSGNLRATATHVHIAREAVVPGVSEAFFGGRSDWASGRAELRIFANEIALAKDAVLEASFTLSDGRFADTHSTGDYLSPEDGWFWSALNEVESDDGRTVTYRLRARNDFEYRGVGEPMMRFRPFRILITEATAVSVTAVIKLVHDGSEDGLEAPEVWLETTKTLAYVESVVPPITLRAPPGSEAHIAFPHAQTLNDRPVSGGGQAVRLIAGEPQVLLGWMESEKSRDAVLRDENGGLVGLDDVDATVTVTLRTSATGGRAFMDGNGDRKLSPGEGFPPPDEHGEQRISLEPGGYNARTTSIYYAPPLSWMGIRPEVPAVCVSLTSALHSNRITESYGCANVKIVHDAEPPQYAVGLLGDGNPTPSVLILTCLDLWQQCQIRAECRDRDGAAHFGLLDNLAPGAAAVYAAGQLASTLEPSGFLSTASANPGHCRFHSSNALSVQHRLGP